MEIRSTDLLDQTIGWGSRLQSSEVRWGKMQQRQADHSILMIDGSRYSGSGTIVQLTVMFSVRLI
ncbi:MAG: hypothetical protein AB7L09_19310 [Nitrospira sp.]